MHKMIKMTTNHGDTVKIDEDISDLISILWELGIDTMFCCQGNGDYFRLSFEPNYLKMFLDKMANSKLNQFISSTSINHNKWDYDILVNDKFKICVTIYIPKIHKELIKEILCDKKASNPEPDKPLPATSRNKSEFPDINTLEQAISAAIYEGFTSVGAAKMMAYEINRLYTDYDELRSAYNLECSAHKAALDEINRLSR